MNASYTIRAHNIGYRRVDSFCLLHLTISYVYKPDGILILCHSSGGCFEVFGCVSQICVKGLSDTNVGSNCPANMNENNCLCTGAEQPNACSTEVRSPHVDLTRICTSSV